MPHGDDLLLLNAEPTSFFIKIHRMLVLTKVWLVDTNKVHLFDSIFYIEGW